MEFHIVCGCFLFGLLQISLGTDVILINEGFEDGIIPNGWEKYSQGEGWIIGTTTSVSSSSFSVPSHPGNVIASRDVSNNNNGLYDYLVTPPLNLSTSDQYLLQFDSYYNGKQGQTATVQITINQTSSFYSILQLQPNANWVIIQLNLGRWKGCASAQIRFWSSDGGYPSTSTSGSGWAIDNVLIVGKDILSAPSCPTFLNPTGSVLSPGSPIMWNQSTDATEYLVTYGSWNPYKVYDNNVSIGYSSLFIPQKHEAGVSYFFQLVAANRFGLSSPCMLNFTSLSSNNLTLPYEENFTPSTFPQLWTQETFDNGDWTISNSSSAYSTVEITDHTGNSGNFLFKKDSGYTLSGVLLPPLNMSGHNNVSMSFFVWLAFPFTLQAGYIHVDVWFNNTWCYDVISPVLVNGTVPVPSPPWQQQIVDLTPFMGNFSVVRIRGQTGDGSLAPLALDDFLIQADSSFVAPPANLSNCFSLPATSSYDTVAYCPATDAMTSGDDIQSGGNDDTGVIIGATVGSVAGFLIVSAMISIFLVLRHKKSKERKQEFRQQMSMQPVSEETTSSSDGNTQYLSYNRESWAAHTPKSSTSNPTSFSLQSTSSTGSGQHTYTSWENSMAFPIMEHGISRAWVIDYKELEMQKELGFGSFGVVFKALWRKSEVAVKKLKATDFNEKKLSDFLTEADLLMKLRPHTNVVQFQGVCLQPLCLIYEYLPMGNLYQFVRANEMDLVFQAKILRGIAAGMLHLHSEKIIHRDLAARNILLSGDLIPKVSDFGMSRLIETESSGMQTQTTTGPLKWMAPESLTHRVYSNKTDVWSYGVLIYEIFLKQDPYPHLDPVQSATQLILGQVSLLTDFPSNIHPQVLFLVTACLQVDPQKRPEFDQICEMLDSLLEVLTQN
mmetsp:Transcript_19817/g.27674  ORF Transcript_19817/g.27674 Transcript_19817/m.27674 type:complete len:892 (-) Transcript_19817:24-2699(-)